MKTWTLSLILFSLLLTSTVFAYTEYNDNPYIENSTNDFGVYNDYNVSVVYNATCGSYSGCMIATWDNSTTSNNFVLLNRYKNPYNVSTALVQYDNITMLTSAFVGFTYSTPFEAGQENLVYLNYYNNATLLDPKVIVYSRGNDGTSQLNQTIFEESLNSSAGWHSQLISIGVLEDWAFLRISFQATFTNATQLFFDEFKLYTVDRVDTREYWGTYTTERTRYCNNDGWGGQSPSYVVSDNGTIGYVLCNTTENTKVGVFKLGNTTIARRVHNTSYVFSTSDIFEFRDMYFFRWNDNGNWSVLLTKVELNQIEATVFNLFNSSLLEGHLYYNNVPSPYALMYNGSEQGIIYDYNQSIRALIPMSSYMNDTIAGSQWALSARTGTGTTAFYEFFTSDFACYPRTICDIATNTQYVRTITCGLANAQDCEAWGCNPSGTECNWGFVGSYCLGETALLTVNGTGHTSYEYCSLPERCYNVTPTTAECLTDDEYEDWNYTSKTFTTDPAEKTALGIASWFGITDSDLAKQFFALIISLVGSVGVLMVVAHYTKGSLDGSAMIQGFSILAVLFLIMFTIIGWFNPLLIVLITVLVSFFMVKSLGVFGGR